MIFSFLWPSKTKQQATDNMWLLVGLGNPGDKYDANRHNIGFMVIDAIADDYHFPAFKSKYQGDYSQGTIGGEKVLLLKPQTYMNNSGQSVGALAKFYKIPADRIIVFHDELDLNPGKMRVKFGGGLAGHNGLKSMKAHLGTQDFWRVRMGIGHPGDKNRVSGYVLSDFAKAEKPQIDKMIEACAQHVADLFTKGGDEDYMTKVAR
ncbi:MAG: aminoacyl-tRNA hydrolase [Alphaproteobacteria bacterium]|nr:aminoacyl-tRNA hydrolase [Alphaproteobacteria bacterium]MDP7222855.1 aminoacyl-tRNA hydrolase [Alphaproteobacteria bacterium]